MEKKAISGIMLALLLLSMLSLAFNIQPVKGYFNDDEDDGTLVAGTLDISVSDSPDPFNPLIEQSTITISNEGTISVKVFLALTALNPIIPGFLPRTWEWESVENGNSVQAIWDGKDGAGNIVPPGIYNYTAIARQLNGGFSAEKTGTITIVLGNTLYVPNDYSTIQGAVNAARSGDTIIVRDGTYTENVNVNKDHLTINSESGAEVTTVQAVNPDHPVFEITSNYSNISGFSVRGSYDNYGIYFSHVKGCNISHNKLLNNLEGLCLWYSSNNIISGNNISSNNWKGIYLHSSSNNIISGNNISNNWEGIDLYSSSNNVISGNNISSHNYGGICLGSSSNTTILGNSFFNDGLYVGGSYRNTVSNNMVNSKPLVYLEEESDAIIDDAGQVILVGCYNITIQNQELSNTHIGVELWDTDNCLISGNNITSNDLFGVCLYYSSTNNIISGNNISNNKKGIEIWYSSNNNLIYLNSFLNNSDDDWISSGSTNLWNSPEKIAYTYNSKPFINYLGNYWSDYTGSDADEDGIGDTPYRIYYSNKDNYPLIDPFENYEMGLLPTDTTPPDTKITGGPSGTINYNDVTFTWTGSDDVAPTSELVYSYYLKSYESEWSDWTLDTSKSYNDLPNGDYTFKVKARDQTGNTDPTPAEISFTISITQPHIDSINPPSGASGIEVKIRGLNFDNIVVIRQVTFGWQSAKIIDWSDTEIVVEVPPGEGTIDVTVGPFPSSNSVRFTYEEPVVDFIYPSFGKLGTEVTIEGRHFGLPRSLQNYVKFGKSTAKTVSWTDTEIVVEAPSDYGTGESDRKILKWLIKLAVAGYTSDIPDLILDIIDELLSGVEIPPSEGKIEVEVRVNTPTGTSNAVVFTYQVSTIIEAYLCSPGELRVYDSLGHITGLVNGEVKEEIPYSLCDGSTVIIVSPYDCYRYEVVGTDEGAYGLVVSYVEYEEITTFAATEIPMTSGATHEYTIDWDALSLGEEGVTVQVDADGDGAFEQSISADNELTHDEFMLQTATTLDFDPYTLNLDSEGKWVTVYIELPEGYDVSNIDTESIELATEVVILTNEVEVEEFMVHIAPGAPTAIGDYDSDGIPDLMVKFDRAELVEYLGKAELDSVDGLKFYDVTLTVTGTLTDGTPFLGSDTIKVIKK